MSAHSCNNRRVFFCFLFDNVKVNKIYLHCRSIFLSVIFVDREFNKKFVRIFYRYTRARSLMKTALLWNNFFINLPQFFFTSSFKISVALKIEDVLEHREQTFNVYKRHFLCSTRVAFILKNASCLHSI